ncbi:MAG TPA: hypothetical protein VHX59_24615 [Mycobacteriales bacterium]|nr:hypothetical protein [Mycobacteriales bacterium]
MSDTAAERTELLEVLAQQRTALRNAVRHLTEEQAATAASASTPRDDRCPANPCSSGSA